MVRQRGLDVEVATAPYTVGMERRVATDCMAVVAAARVSDMAVVVAVVVMAVVVLLSVSSLRALALPM